MKSLDTLRQEIERLEVALRENNACGYAVGVGEVSEGDIQQLHEMVLLYETVVRTRSLEHLVDEINLAERFLDYYNPDNFCLYYKDLDKEDKEHIKKEYKHWKSIHESLMETFEERSKNIFIED